MTFGFTPSTRERLVRLAEAVAGERACERLVVGYAHAIDFGRMEAIGDIFVETATFDALGTTLAGRAEVTRAIGVLVEHHPVTRHAISSIAVHTHSDGTADGISYLSLFGAGPSPLLVGHLRDRFITDSGAGWRIEHRRLDAVFVDDSFAWPGGL